MTGFKIGDTVRYTEDGDVGVVSEKSGYLYTVDFPGPCKANIFEEQLELVEPASEFDPPLEPWEKDLLQTPFEKSVTRITDGIAKLLIEKNKAYGDSALNPVRVFSKASRIEQLNVRIDDKISRIQRGTDFGDEDTIRDLIGYLVLRLIAEESE